MKSSLQGRGRGRGVMILKDNGASKQVSNTFPSIATSAQNKPTSEIRQGLPKPPGNSASQKNRHGLPKPPDSGTHSSKGTQGGAPPMFDDSDDEYLDYPKRERRLSDIERNMNIFQHLKPIDKTDNLSRKSEIEGDEDDEEELDIYTANTHLTEKEPEDWEADASGPSVFMLGRSGNIGNTAGTISHQQVTSKYGPPMDYDNEADYVDSFNDFEDDYEDEPVVQKVMKPNAAATSSWTPLDTKKKGQPHRQGYKPNAMKNKSQKSERTTYHNQENPSENYYKSKFDTTQSAAVHNPSACAQDEEVELWDEGVPDSMRTVLPPTVQGNTSGTLGNPDVNKQWMEDLDKATTRNIKMGPEQTDRMWLKQLEDLWAVKEKPVRAVTELLGHCFRSVENPYHTALFLTENCKDSSGKGSSNQAFGIMKEFDRWAHLARLPVDEYIDKPLRIWAFKVATYKQMAEFEYVTRTYKLDHAGNEYFLEFIRSFIEQKCYKEAAQCISKLKLQSHFDIKEVALPLVLQDKVNLVESYVFRNEEQQVELMKLLDHLCDKKVDIFTFVDELGVPKVKKDKLQRKILSKLAIRLMKLYQIPQEVCPNISKERSVKALRYLMYKGFVEKTLEKENWDDLIKGSIQDNIWLQEELIEQLVDYCEIGQGARWARYYNIPMNKLPHQVREVLHRQDKDGLVDDLGTWHQDLNSDETTQSPIHYNLKLPLDRIHFVDTRQGYYQCLEAVTKSGSIVGLDAEWKPTFGQTVSNRMALLQIAIIDNVYLLDMIALQSILRNEEWLNMAESLFLNPDVLKLGYGFDSDLKMLAKSFPVMKEPLKHLNRLVDLCSFNSQITRLSKDIMDPEPIDDSTASSGEVGAEQFKVEKNEEQGLSALVRRCLGKPLNKKQQMSDWERRPLKQTQIIYAALDAHCLIEVYEVLKKKVIDNNIKFNLEPCMSGKWAKNKRSKQERQQDKVSEKAWKREKPQKQMPPKHEGPPIRPHEFAVVVDTMLQGLGRYLRCCGVDVRILDNHEDHDVAAEVARRENRVILTSGTPFLTLRSQVPIGCCMNVSPGKCREQITEVMEYFNLQISPGDIFSRCQSCNGNKYISIPACDMKILYEQKALMLQNETKTIPKDISSLLKDKTLQDEVDLTNLIVKGSQGEVSVQVDSIPMGKLDQVDAFCVCATCGKVFWQGRHFDRVTTQFSHILTEEDQQTIYDQVKKSKEQVAS